MTAIDRLRHDWYLLRFVFAMLDQPPLCRAHRPRVLKTIGFGPTPGEPSLITLTRRRGPLGRRGSDSLIWPHLACSAVRSARD